MIVLLDFTEAFDCISHKLLLDKLHKIVIDDGPIRWLSSYLMSRKQSVRDKNGCPTGYRPVASWVPQGSILGPPFFLGFLFAASPTSWDTPPTGYMPIIRKSIIILMHLKSMLPLQGFKRTHKQLRTGHSWMALSWTRVRLNSWWWVVCRTLPP